MAEKVYNLKTGRPKTRQPMATCRYTPGKYQAHKKKHH